jgi:hypothetical protein
MPTDRQLDDSISRWLEAEAPGQVPDRVLRATFERTRRTRQEASWQAVLRRLQMNRLILALGGAAAVVVVAFVALGPYSNQPGVGAPPAVEPTAPPTASPPPAPNGELPAGTYSAHPLPAPNDALTVAFTVPEGWMSLVGDPGTGGFDLVPSGEPGTGPPGGRAIQFIDVTTLNGDPCTWSGTDDDVSVGPGVDDLVEALRAQSAYEVSDPVDVTIGGYSGRRVDIVHPTEPFAGPDSLAPACDDGVFRLWSTTAHGPHPIHAQGPANRWHANILDVDGARLVIVAADFPGTLPGDRAEMDAIIGSIAIEP